MTTVFKKIFIALFLSLTGVLIAMAQGNLIGDAEKAYMDNDFETALEYYMKAADRDGSSSQLYYNIGNTYYRLGELGNAVLYYKKALKLDPSNNDARTNLDFLQSKLVDQQDFSKPWATRITEAVIFQMSPNGWAVTGLIFFFLFLGLLWIYLHSDVVGVRKLTFFGGIAVVALATLSTIAAFKTSGMVRDNREAIIITPAVKLSTVPRIPMDKNEEAFTLHEGAVVEIIDSLKVPSDSVYPLWFEIKVNDEHRAWIPAADLDRV